jgi:hypothetical protein
VRGVIGVVAADIDRSPLTAERRGDDGADGHQVPPDAWKLRFHATKFVAAFGMADQDPGAALQPMHHVEHGMPRWARRSWRNERLQPDDEILARDLRHVVVGRNDVADARGPGRIEETG